VFILSSSTAQGDDFNQIKGFDHISVSSLVFDEMRGCEMRFISNGIGINFKNGNMSRLVFFSYRIQGEYTWFKAY